MKETFSKTFPYLGNYNRFKFRVFHMRMTIDHLLFSDPTFYKWGRKIMIYDAFFSKFCQNSTCLTIK